LQQTTELNGEYPVLIWYLDVYSPFFPIEVVALPDVVVFSLRVQPKISPGNGVPQKSDENGNGAFLTNDLNICFEQFIQSVSNRGSAQPQLGLLVKASFYALNNQIRVREFDDHLTINIFLHLTARSH
jgi:hypothetical protein